MPGYLDSIKGIARSFGKGLLLEAAPQIISGVIIQLFHQWKLDKAVITEYVNNDVSLWSKMTLRQQKQLTLAATQLGSLDFLTPEFVVESIKDDFLSVASLLVNWPEAGEWLARQIEEIKAGVSNTDISH
jgi:hypothetical protein